MKVIWLTNVLFPQVCEHLGIPVPVLGGWMYGYYAALRHYCPEIRLYIVSPYEGTESFKVELDDSVFYAYPAHTDTDSLAAWLQKINDEIKPDVVHLHGSEFIHASLFVKVCGPQKVVLSIQGLISACADYYWGGIERRDLNRFRTFRDVVKNDTVRHQQLMFEKRGKAETWLIAALHNIAGRTSWDRSVCWALNPGMRYFQCEEALRDSFYEQQWSLSRCNRHTIFLSQVSYPLKGFHKFLKALPLIIRQYPDVQVYIVGEDLTRKPKYRRLTYWNYLADILKDAELSSRCHFLGRLEEKDMCRQYLSAHVFVCPSIIENSSNSVCEAQLLGTPTVAANVGGMSDLITHEQSGMLYRFEETAMLAYEVCRIFADDELACSISEGARKAASVRHDRENIALSLKKMYTDISKE